MNEEINNYYLFNNIASPMYIQYVRTYVRTYANLCIDYYFMFACCAGAKAAACNQSLYGFSISKCSAMCKSLLFVVVYRLTYMYIRTYMCSASGNYFTGSAVNFSMHFVHNVHNCYTELNGVRT